MRWYAALLYVLLRALGTLPLCALHALGAALGMLFHASHGRKRRIVDTNLRLVRPQLDGAARRGLARAVLVETGKSLVEAFGIWGSAAHTLARVREVRGQALFDDALRSGKGLILCAPHLGSWEVANYWIGARTPFATFYTQPRRAALEPLLRKLRSEGHTLQFPIDDSGVRRVYRHLSSGGVVSIMPDHVPRSGGIVAPFFGVPALTMTLLPRLAARTGANVLMLFVERLPKAAGYRIHFRAAPEALVDPDPLRASTAMNEAVAACIEEAFAQYQWNYKRFKPRADSGLPDCYAHAGVGT